MKIPARFHLRTLRMRLILAFGLVSVPPMLGAAFAVATLISNTFDSNVQDWLGETARYFNSQVVDSQADAEQMAKLLASRLVHENPAAGIPAELVRDQETLATAGLAFMAIYDETGHVLMGSKALPPDTPLPRAAMRTILPIHAPRGDFLLNCAIAEAHVPGGKVFVLVGSLLDQTYLIEGKAISAIKIHLFRLQNGQFKPAAPGADEPNPPPPPRADLVRKLEAGEEIVVDDDPGDGIYKSLYASVRDADHKLLAAAFIGLSEDDSFIAQFGQFGIFPGIFIIGTLLSTLAGLWLSGYLAKPLQALNEGVRAVTAGDYSRRVTLKGGDELEELATGFNGMAAQLSKLQELEDQLRRKDRLSALGEASAVIAHEVRNPLGIIKASAEVVRNRADLRPAEARLLGYVIDETRRIEKLIREVLDFAQPKAIAREPVAIRPALEAVMAFAQPEFAARNIKAEVLDHAPGARILGDADQLHQALLNLVLNAVEAMPEGGTITAMLESDEALTHLTIQDTGQGIPLEISERIFDPFFTTKAKGTGLGLAQVQSLAEALGGRVAIVPHAAQGAAIRLSLPLLKTA